VNETKTRLLRSLQVRVTYCKLTCR